MNTTENNQPDQTLDDPTFLSMVSYELSLATTFDEVIEIKKDYSADAELTFNRLVKFRHLISNAVDTTTQRPKPYKSEEVFKDVGGNARGGLPITEEEQEAIDEGVEPAEAPQPKSNREWYEHYKALFPTAKYNPRMKGIDNLTQLEFFQLLTFQLSREFDKAELPSFNDVVLHTCSIQSVAAAQEYIKELASRINK